MWREARSDKVRSFCVSTVLAGIALLALSATGCRTFTRGIEAGAEDMVEKIAVAEIEKLVDRKMTEFAKSVAKDYGPWVVAFLVGGGGAALGKVHEKKRQNGNGIADKQKLTSAGR